MVCLSIVGAVIELIYLVKWSVGEF